MHLASLARGTFRLGLQSAGCYLGSELARTSCLLYAPAVLNYLGYQLATDFGCGKLLAWTSGRAVLSISYDHVEGAARAMGGALGTKAGGAVADSVLYLFDKLTDQTPTPSSTSDQRLQIRNARVQRFQKPESSKFSSKNTRWAVS